MTIIKKHITSFIVLLTKSDVRKYVVDLVTLSYLNCSCATKVDGTNNVTDPAKKSPNALQPGEPSNNNTTATADITARKSSQVSNEEKVDSTDEECDEETGVSFYESKRTTSRRSLRVSATGNPEIVQLAGNDTSIG